ncbi:MAG: DUF5717 family protein [Lachnospiraceae bacterium]|nr:DUF5717 family protein [Lachnospiraceae bacterium]
MRKRIWRMSEDKFDDIAPIIEFHNDKLELFGFEEENFESFFDIHSVNDVRVRGMVYSSNPYVVVLNPQFDDVDVKIRFKTTHNGFRAGDELKGEFYVTANQVVKVLPYTISFDKKYPIVNDMEIRSLKDFALLAKDNFTEALQLFSTNKLDMIMKNESMKNRLYYGGFKSTSISALHLEEFLVAVKQKDRCRFDVKEDSLSFYNIKENQKESIHISKNTWGYVEFRVTCDADFITIEKEHLNSDFFLGNNLELNFYIHKERLHSGINEAKIVFEGLDNRKEISLVCSLYDKDAHRNDQMISEKKDRFELSRLYVDYRLKKMTTGDWTTKSIELLDQLIELHPTDYMYPLQKAQALIVNKQRQDALWMITDLKRDIEDKKSVEWAYLLYLCTLLEQEDNYVNKLTEEIEYIFKEHPDDVRVFWFLLFLREAYIKDSRRKLYAIKQWVDAGCHSPYLYIEAYQIFLQDPILLTELNGFSLKILNWAAKHGQVSVNLAVRFQELLPEEKQYSELVFTLACRIYERYPEKELLFSIMSYLLKNNKVGEKYFKWYAKAVDKELKLTGLFEAYILSLPENYGERLPEIVTLFFRYENRLPVDKKAMIYANVINYKKNNIHLYEQYLPQIQRFSLEQMHLGRMNDDLATCYQDMLEAGLIDEEIATDLSKLVYTKRFVCLRNDIKRIVVFEEMFQRPRISNVKNGIAYFTALTENYVVFLETFDGNYITDQQGYYIDEMMKKDAFIGKLNYLSNYAMYYFLAGFDQVSNVEDINQKQLGKIKDFLYNDELSLSYKRKKLNFISSLLREHEREDLLVKFLVDYKEYRNLDSNTAAHIIDLLIVSDDYMTAYEMMGIYNGLLVPAKSLLRLCNYMIMEIGDQAEDFLISLLAYLMKQYLFTDESIEYLCNYFVGPTDDMLSLWKFAEARGFSTGALEERILTQMLYSDDVRLESGEIFDSYMKKRVSPMIVEAYLTYWSRIYICDKSEVPEQIFQRIYLMFDQKRPMNNSLRIGLLKYLCTKPQLEEREYKVLDFLLRDCLSKNIYFEFYRHMDENLLIKYHLYDKQFVEFRGTKNQNITMSYVMNSSREESERMMEMYDGIYVKQFVLFFGDVVRYEIIDSDNNDVLVEDELTYQEVIEREKQSRFGMLNQIKSDFVYKNEKELLKDLKFYEGLDVTTRNIFKIIHSTEGMKEN